MCKPFYTILLFSAVAINSLAQDHPKVETESGLYDLLFESGQTSADIHIVQEEKLDRVMLMFMEQNRKLEGIPLYWIRIYSGSSHDSREKANQVKGAFLRKYEGNRIKVIYDDPNFKVYVGGYRSRSETLMLLNTMKKDFRNAFIVYDIIDFPE